MHANFNISKTLMNCICQV